MLFTEKEKIAILKNVELIVHADGMIHDKEKVFVLQLINSFELSINLVALKTKIMSIEEAALVIKNMNNDKKEHAKKLMIAASLVDNDLDEKELLVILALFEVFESR